GALSWSAERNLRAEMWEVVFGRREGNLLPRWCVSGCHEVCRCIVIDGCMRHGTHNAKAVCLLSQPRQQFRDLHARHTGRNWVKYTAHFLGSGRLHVPDVELAWSAVQEEEDTGTQGRGRTLCGGMQKLRQTQRAQPAELQPAAAR